MVWLDRSPLLFWVLDEERTHAGMTTTGDRCSGAHPRFAHVVARAFGTVVAGTSRRAERPTFVFDAQVFVAGDHGTVAVCVATVGNRFEAAHGTADPAGTVGRGTVAVGVAKLEDL